MKRRILSLSVIACLLLNTGAPSVLAAENNKAGQRSAQSPSYSIGWGNTEITLYCMSDEVPYMIEEYFKRNPTINYDYTVEVYVRNNDNRAYETMLNDAFDGNYAPDIYVAEADYVLPYTIGEYSSYAAPYSDFIVDFENKKAAADIMQYAVELGTNSNGQIVALPYQSTIGTMIYRRDIAEEVLGATTQAEVEAAVGAGTNTWTQFLEVAEKMKNSGYAMISGLGDIWNVVEKASPTPWVVNDELVIHGSRRSFLDLSKKIIDNRYSNDTSAWSQAWYEEMGGYGEREVFCFFGPCWLINYVMRNYADEYSYVYGKYGVCQSPVPFWWGGSWLFVSTEARSDPSKNTMIAQIIEWITLDCTTEGLQYSWANGTLNPSGTKDAVASKTVMSMVNGDLGLLGGQNPFPTYIAASENTHGKSKCEYDTYINGYFYDCFYDYAHGEVDREEAIEEFLENVEYCCDVDVDYDRYLPKETSTPATPSKTTTAAPIDTTTEPAESKTEPEEPDETEEDTKTAPSEKNISSSKSSKDKGKKSDGMSKKTITIIVVASLSAIVIAGVVVTLIVLSKKKKLS